MNALTATDRREGALRRTALGQFSVFTFLPTVLYSVAFGLLTWPLATTFSSDFWASKGDGMQGVWNLWWLPYAVADLGTNPWWTNHLHYPNGSWLLGHNLMEFDGVLALLSRPWLSLVQIHNGVVLFSFVATGVTSFWLAHKVSGSWLGSWVGGFVFTFSSYHFAHAEGHLHITSMEFLPLFVLVWLQFLERPSGWRGAGAGVVLTLNLLCAPYFFVYGAMAGAVLAIWWLWETWGVRVVLQSRDLWVGLTVFVLVVVGTAGVWIAALFSTSSSDPLLGSHAARVYSMDLLAPFIPGGHWRFAEWTRQYWSQLPGNIHESSVHVGLAATFLVGRLLWVRRKLASDTWVPWLWLTVIFAVLSLGPVLLVWGEEVLSAGMPYSWLKVVFPQLEMAGAPVRMMVVTQLGVSVLVAVSVASWSLEGSWARAGLALVLAAIVVESLPTPIPTTSAKVPAYVDALRTLPGDGVIDATRFAERRLYYQTVHEKRLVGGYLSRLPTSARLREHAIRIALERGHVTTLCAWNVRYVVSPVARPALSRATLRHRDDAHRIEELVCSPNEDGAQPD